MIGAGVGWRGEGERHPRDPVCPGPWSGTNGSTAARQGAAQGVEELVSGTSSRLTVAELEAEGGLALPTKQVLSLLDLDANIDLALALAAPIDLAIAANLNIAAPIDAAVSANVLSVGSDSVAAATQQVLIDQSQSGSAIAIAPQDATIEQAADADAPAPTDTTTAPAPTTGTTTDGGLDVASLLAGPLLDVDVNVDADLDIAAPIAGAVAANANIAAPIDAAVSANVLSIDSSSTAVASQTAIITQSLDGVVAEASATQTATISQP